MPIETTHKLGMIPLEKMEKMQPGCCFSGCERTYHGDMPRDWRSIIMCWSPNQTVDLMSVRPEHWSRDGVLCPEHVAAVQNLLLPLTDLRNVAIHPSVMK